MVPYPAPGVAFLATACAARTGSGAPTVQAG